MSLPQYFFLYSEKTKTNDRIIFRRIVLKKPRKKRIGYTLQSEIRIHSEGKQYEIDTQLLAQHPPIRNVDDRYLNTRT